MNEIERALAKTAKREAKKVLVMEPGPIGYSEDTDDFVQVFKEKPKKDAIFTVNVSLPNGDFSFTLTKTSVYSHISPNRLTMSEIKRHFAEGLKPILGGLD